MTVCAYLLRLAALTEGAGSLDDVQIISSYEAWWDWVEKRALINTHEMTSLNEIQESESAARVARTDEHAISLDSSDDRDIPDEDFLETRGDEFEFEKDKTPDLSLVVEKLMVAAKRHKSFAALFKLQAVQQYMQLTERYSRIPAIKNPRTRASAAVALGVGKGPYFSRQIRHLKLYIARFHTLPPTNSGKHHGHPSLLNNEHVLHAVRRYLTVVANGEVSLRSNGIPEITRSQIDRSHLPSSRSRSIPLSSQHSDLIWVGRKYQRARHAIGFTN